MIRSGSCSVNFPPATSTLMLPGVVIKFDSMRAMSLEELQWFIADAERASAGWQPRLVAGGRRK
jgi:hypothetical protein